GGIWGGMKATFHHNLLAHHSSRTPRFCGSRYHGNPAAEIVDHRNNVIFNWGGNSCYGGESGNQNMIANYYRYGPATSGEKKYRIAEPSDGQGKWYIADNFVFDYPIVTRDNWKGGVQGSYANQVRTDTPIPAAWVVTHTAQNAFEQVLLDAGASLRRDFVDLRIVQEVRTGMATFGGSYGVGKGIIDSQKDAGGWPELTAWPAPADDDHDGMPNDWEEWNGLNPSNPSDRNGDQDGDGYTNLEDYLNGLCIRPDFIPAPAALHAEGLSDANPGIRLTWQEDSQNESGFLVERSENRDAGYTHVGLTDSNDTAFTDTSVKPQLKYYYRVRAIKDTLRSMYTNVDSAVAEASTAAVETALPPGCDLKVDGYPNPFNPIVTVEYTLPSRGRIVLSVFDPIGREVARLADGVRESGQYSVSFDASKLASGLYVARLETASGFRAKKLVFMR
ncbi:MAG TPA: T9SS type A sorting domain-containing protein, partial [bacterium]